MCAHEMKFRSVAKGTEFVDASGHSIPQLLEAILELFPLDQYVESPVMLMDLVESDKIIGMKVFIISVPFVGNFITFYPQCKVPVWEKYQKLLDKSDGKPVRMSKIERFAFYDRAKEAYAVVATGETTPYGNIILKKGVIA